MAVMRLDKYIADLGLASRRETRELIHAGHITVEGLGALMPDTKLDTDTARVLLDGKKLCYRRYHYYLLNKPAGILTATEDRRQGTVLDLVSPEMRRMGLFPVGRLDKDTEGLLLLTDDGDFVHRVISPRSAIEKLYYAQVGGTVENADILAFRDGVELKDGTRCLPAALVSLGAGECLVTVMEGKYHQVKRMLASRGKPGERLERVAIGGLTIPDDLPRGGWCELDRERLFTLIREKVSVEKATEQLKKRQIFE